MLPTRLSRSPLSLCFFIFIHIIFTFSLSLNCVLSPLYFFFFSFSSSPIFHLSILNFLVFPFSASFPSYFPSSLFSLFPSLFPFITFLLHLPPSSSPPFEFLSLHLYPLYFLVSFLSSFPSFPLFLPFPYIPPSLTFIFPSIRSFTITFIATSFLKAIRFYINTPLIGQTGKVNAGIERWWAKHSCNTVARNDLIGVWDQCCFSPYRVSSELWLIKVRLVHEIGGA